MNTITKPTTHRADVIVDGVEYEIIYLYVPGELATYDYPGSAPEFDILEVSIHGHDVIDHIKEWVIDAIISEAREYHESNHSY